jgi:hypothetical protein
VWLKPEAFPFWLLALDANLLVSQPRLISFLSLDALTKRLSETGESKELLNAALVNLETSKVLFSQKETPPQDALYLVSGSRSFVNKYPQTCQNPILVLCDQYVRSRRMTFPGPLQWSRLHHETFGGSTLLQVALGTNIQAFNPVQTQLCCTICHVLEYGLKP